MLGRHRMRRYRRRRRLRVSATMGLVAALVAAGAIAVQRVSADASGCTGRVGLSVAATPEIAPALHSIASDWEGTRPQVDGACVEVTIVPTLAPVMAARLTSLAGGTIDVEAPAENVTSAESLPDVWVPDSTAWLGRVRDVNRAAFVNDPHSIATSPIVFAVPQPTARRIGWPNSPLQLTQFEQNLIAGDSPLTMAFADPHRDTPALVATMLIGEPLAGSDANLRALIRTFRALVKTHDTAQVLPLLGRDASAAPVSEQAVIAFNGRRPAVPLAALQLVPAPPDLDYPYAVRSDIADDRSRAADMFRTAINAPVAAQKLAEAAFRDPNGIAGPGFPAATATNAGPVGAFAVDDPPRVQSALNLWAAVNEPPRALTLFDVSASMKTKTANGQTRAQVLADAAHQGLNLLATDSEVGLWTFANEHDDVLSVAPLTSARRANFDQRLAAAARPTASDQVDLYGAVADAYEQMQSAFDPARPNFIIVLTDGGDSSPGGQRLKDFGRRIEQMADPTEPIRIAIIGIDVSPAGAGDLQQVVNLVGGGYFPLTDPIEIQTVVLKALLAVGEA